MHVCVCVCVNVHACDCVCDCVYFYFSVFAGFALIQKTIFCYVLFFRGGAGLKAFQAIERGPPDIVIVHDAVRPFVDEKVHKKKERRK